MSNNRNHEINEEVYQAQLQEELHRNRLEVHHEAVMNIPKNSQKKYKLASEFIAWAEKKRFRDKDTVNEEKLCLFLRQEVIGRKKRKGKSEAIVGWKVVEGYITAILKLYSEQVKFNTVISWVALFFLLFKQKARNMNNNPHPRGDALKELSKNEQIKEAQRKKNDYVDRGIGTLLDGYSNSSDLEKIASAAMETNSEVGLRTKAMFFMAHAMMLRGESERMYQLADLFSLELDNEGYGECRALVGIMDQGKMNQMGRLEFGAFLRHR
jgi:hypothetical protein